MQEKGYKYVFEFKVETGLILTSVLLTLDFTFKHHIVLTTRLYSNGKRFIFVLNWQSYKSEGCNVVKQLDDAP